MYESGRVVFYNGRDYYLMRDGELMAFSERFLHGHLEAGISPGAIKFGRWAPSDIYQQAAEMAGAPR